jgi:hypothetical protein
MTDSKGTAISSSDKALSRETSWTDDVESRRVKKWRFSEARLDFSLAQADLRHLTVERSTILPRSLDCLLCPE